MWFYISIVVAPHSKCHAPLGFVRGKNSVWSIKTTGPALDCELCLPFPQTIISVNNERWNRVAKPQRAARIALAPLPHLHYTRRPNRGICQSRPGNSEEDGSQSSMDYHSNINYLVLVLKVCIPPPPPPPIKKKEKKRKFRLWAWAELQNEW